VGLDAKVAIFILNKETVVLSDPVSLEKNS
jgi:hypothetical protein